MSLTADIRQRVARWIAPKPVAKANGQIRHGSAAGGFGTRMYAAARASRMTGGWQTSNSSSDFELSSSLTRLRSRSRALIRDAAYAKRARTIVVNNVIGSGIGMQGQVMTSRTQLYDKVNDAIEREFEKWSRKDSCHTGGTLHMADLERMAVGQVFDAGEVVIRKHYRAFGDSTVPFALELIEAERLADEMSSPTGPTSPAPGNRLRMGIEVDQFYRPVAYWVHSRHPGEMYVGENETTRSDTIERVPANQIIHLRVVDRWPQSRGEPWLHTAVAKLNHMDVYSEAEIEAARGAACYWGGIETAEGINSGPGDQTDEDGTESVEVSPGMMVKLAPGEKMNFFTPSRPNTALDPFMRYMLREVAAGVGVSYESLSKDYSQSNYSSSRLALLDDRDLWRTLQLWFIRNVRDEIHREWLQQAVYARAIPEISVAEYLANRSKFEAVRWKPRGWSWIDPEKEVAARKDAVRSGMDTLTNVIAETGSGRDFEDIINERERELQMAKAKGLNFDTDVVEVAPAQTTSTETTSQNMPTETLTGPKVVNLGKGPR